LEYFEGLNKEVTKDKDKKKSKPKPKKMEEDESDSVSAIREDDETLGKGRNSEDDDK
jgi:hypothetical protein